MSLNLRQYLPYDPFPKQVAFCRMAHREVLYGGSAGCSKSSALLMAALQGIEIPTYSAIIFRRTFSDLKLPGALIDRSKQWWLDTDADWSDQDKTWTFPSGARICFGYLDSRGDLDRYQSAEFHYIGIDEVSEFCDAEYTFLFSRLRRTKRTFPRRFPLRFRAATNPGGLGHEFLVKRFGIDTSAPIPFGSPPIYTLRDDGTVRRVFVPAHPQDNPGLDWKDYALSLSELSEVKQKQLRDNWWIQDRSGLVYDTSPDADYVDALPSGYQWRYVLAIDFGASNTLSLAIIAYCDELDEVYVFRVEEPEDMNNPIDLAEYVLPLEKQYHFERIVCDEGALGKGYANELRKHFAIPVQAAEKSNKRGYIQLFNGAVESGFIKFVRGSVIPWTRQSGTLLWKDGEKLKEMPGMRNHSCDSVLYGWRECRHYLKGHRKHKEDKKEDHVEASVIQRIEQQRQQVERYGVALPSYYRG